jgi:putative transcriptional regulator
MKNREFDQLLASIDEAGKFHAGKIKPGRITRFHPIIVTGIRKKLKLSQARFAHMIGVSVDTLQNWEQGRRCPRGPALALLKVAEVDPGAVMKALMSQV